MRCIFSSAPSVHVGQVPTSAHDKLSILKWHPAGGGGSGGGVGGGGWGGWAQASIKHHKQSVVKKTPQFTVFSGLDIVQGRGLCVSQQIGLQNL